MAHQALAMCEGYLGSWERAIEILDQYAAAPTPVIDNGFFRGCYLGSRAAMLATNGHHVEARADAEQALEIGRGIRNPTCLTLALFTFGWSQWEAVPERALAALDESIALSRAGAVDGGLVSALAVAARIRLALGDRGGAWRGFREALEFARDVGETATLAFALNDMVCALATEDVVFAATLLGALTEGAFRSLMLQVGGAEVERRDHAAAHIREVLTPEGLEAALTRGAGLDHDEVIFFALAELDALLDDSG
jgi:hypothetical protein